MPKFTSIEYKNIQSVGNFSIKVRLDKSPTTLLVGNNGSGKSTLGYAIFFSLFGKFPSGIKLASAINSINKKNLETTITFTERGSDYVVVRGEKPKKFEIYKDGEMLNQNAHSRDQQKVLEQIIGMDFKTFTQVILLNRERYVPFMEMTISERRKIVEDILGITVFSEMNEVCKKRIKENQRAVSNLDNDIALAKTKLDGQQRIITHIQDAINEAKQENQEQIDKNEELIAKNNKHKMKLEEQIDSIDTSGHAKIKQQKKEFESLAIKFDTNTSTIKKTSDFFKENDVCPTCDQDIDSALKQNKQLECDNKIHDIHNVLEEMMGELNTTIDKHNEYEEMQTTKNQLIEEVRQIDYQIKETTKANNKIINKVLETNNEDKLNNEVDAYNKTEQMIVEHRADLEVIIKDGEELERLRVMLKDDGIKAVIVKEYMNLMNKKINEYLYSMGFYINILLDENFKESFNSIDKEDFTMGNLSTGQKARVNIAIWLALLEISSIKNSIVSNIVILDEIFESLDSNGVKDIMSLFNEKLTDKNIFVVTQRAEEFNDLFQSQIKFELNNNFTEMV